MAELQVYEKGHMNPSSMETIERALETVSKVGETGINAIASIDKAREDTTRAINQTMDVIDICLEDDRLTFDQKKELLDIKVQLVDKQEECANVHNEKMMEIYFSTLKFCLYIVTIVASAVTGIKFIGPKA